MNSKYISHKHLMETQYKPITWLVDSILPYGLALLAGKPKVGKSCLSFDLAISIALNKDFLGFKCYQNEVLYISLEDDLRILKTRSQDFTSIKDIPNLYFGDTFPKGQDAVTEVKTIITENPNLRLIIIDILGCIFPYVSGDQSNKYDFVSNVLDAFRSTLKDTDVCLLLLHHTGKKEYAAAQDRILGSTAFQGKVDTFWILEETIPKGTYQLTINGKLIKGEKEIKLLRKPNGAFIISNSTDKPKTEVEKLLQIINNANTPLSPKDVVGLIGKDIQITSTMLSRLFKQKLVTRIGKGQYVSLDYEQRIKSYSPFNG